LPAIEARQNTKGGKNEGRMPGTINRKIQEEAITILLIQTTQGSWEREGGNLAYSVFQEAWPASSCLTLTPKKTAKRGSSPDTIGEWYAGGS